MISHQSFIFHHCLAFEMSKKFETTTNHSPHSRFEPCEEAGCGTNSFQSWRSFSPKMYDKNKKQFSTKTSNSISSLKQSWQSKATNKLREAQISLRCTLLSVSNATSKPTLLTAKGGHTRGGVCISQNIGLTHSPPPLHHQGCAISGSRTSQSTTSD